MRHEHLYSKEKHNKPFLPRILAIFLLVSMVLCGCAKKPSGTDGSDPDNSMNASTQADPINLEQLLLKERGIPYDLSLIHI